MSEAPVIGVDAGGTKLLAGLVREDLTVARRVRRVWDGGGPEEVLATMVEAVREAAAGEDGVRAVGVGIPSLVDFSSGTSVASVHLPLDGVPVRSLLSERLGLPVHLDNDANLATLAEQRAGAGRGARHLVMLTIGTGIGGGIVIDGQLVRGVSGAGAELGHVTVDLDGPECPGDCPNRGCLEAFVSGPAIGREGALAARRDPDSALARASAPITGELVTALAREGDAAALSVLTTVGERLGVGLVGIVNTFNPEVVVIGGGPAAAAGELLLEPARRVVAERALRPSRDQVAVVGARFGEDAGMIGAALFARAEGRA